MLDINDAIARLDRAALSGKSGRHIHYDHTVDLASQYAALATGKDYEQFLVQFHRREDTPQFVQRITLTVPKTPSLLSPAITQFHRTSRLQNIRRDLTYDNRSDDPILKPVKESMGGFYGEGGVDEWLATIYDWISLIDPNSYAVVEFEKEGSKIVPYPVVYFAKNIYEVGRNLRRKLSYLLCELIDGGEYILYAGEYAIRYTVLPDDDTERAKVIRDAKNLYISGPVYQPLDGNGRPIGRAFLRQFYQTQCPFVQAECMGYLPDPTTGFATNVSALEPARFVLIDHLRTGSNYDMSKYLHVMQQKVVVQPVCQERFCNSGEMPDGTKCPICKGTGLQPVHSQPSDTIAVPMPKNMQDMPDLSKFIHYVNVELSTFQELRNDLKDLAAAVNVAIFNTESVTLGEVTAVRTATEIAAKNENKNNTLLPFAQHKASIYRFAVRCQAVFVLDPATFDYQKLGVVYEPPKDLAPASKAEIYAQMQAAFAADAPPAEIEQLVKDLGEKNYEGDPKGLEEFLVRISHLPFIGLSWAQIVYLDGRGYIQQKHMILYAYQDSVFADLERMNEGFYQKKYDDRDKLITAYVDKIREGLSSSALPTLNMGGRVVPLPTSQEQETVTA
jgi:hypothetical protein